MVLKSARQDHLANQDVLSSTKVTEIEASNIINDAIPNGVYGYLNHISTPVHSNYLIWWNPRFFFFFFLKKRVSSNKSVLNLIVSWHLNSTLVPWPNEIFFLATTHTGYKLSPENTMQHTDLVIAAWNLFQLVFIADWYPCLRIKLISVQKNWMWLMEGGT